MGSSISNIIKGVDDGTKQVISQIDPSVSKFKNSSLTFLDDLEETIHSNTEEYLISLRQSLYVWLFSLITFIILVFILIYFLNDILYNLRFSHFTRQYTSLFVITIIIIWIFLISIWSVFSSKQIDWFTLKLLTLCVFLVCSLLLVLIWIRFLSIHQQRIRKQVVSYL